MVRKGAMGTIAFATILAMLASWEIQYGDWVLFSFATGLLLMAVIAATTPRLYRTNGPLKGCATPLTVSVLTMIAIIYDNACTDGYESAAIFAAGLFFTATTILFLPNAISASTYWQRYSWTTLEVIVTIVLVTLAAVYTNLATTLVFLSVCVACTVASLALTLRSKHDGSGNSTNASTTHPPVQYPQ